MSEDFILCICIFGIALLIVTVFLAYHWGKCEGYSSGVEFSKIFHDELTKSEWEKLNPEIQKILDEFKACANHMDMSADILMEIKHRQYMTSKEESNGQ